MPVTTEGTSVHHLLASMDPIFSSSPSKALNQVCM